jgi:hypothetical protein
MAGICFLGINGTVSFPLVVATVIILIAVFITVLYVVSRRFDWKSDTDPLTKSVEDKKLEAHMARMSMLDKSSDMYEVCDKLRKEYRKARIVFAVFIALGLNALFVMGLIDNEVKSLPIIICDFLVSGTISIIILTAAILVENGFIPGNKLKDAIIKQGYDADDVNNDFMHSTLHDIDMGIMTVGKTYYVVYTSKEFRVGKLENITKADHYSIYSHLSRGYNTIRHYIRLHERNNTHRDYKCNDGLNADLLLNRFLIENIKTETFPAGRKSPETDIMTDN